MTGDGLYHPLMVILGFTMFTTLLVDPFSYPSYPSSPGLRRIDATTCGLNQPKMDLSLSQPKSLCFCTQKKPKKHGVQPSKAAETKTSVGVSATAWDLPPADFMDQQLSGGGTILQKFCYYYHYMNMLPAHTCTNSCCVHLEDVMLCDANEYCTDGTSHIFFSSRLSVRSSSQLWRKKTWVWI